MASDDLALLRGPWPIPAEHWIIPIADADVTCPGCREACGLEARDEEAKLS